VAAPDIVLLRGGGGGRGFCICGRAECFSAGGASVTCLVLVANIYDPLIVQLIGGR
jgi:hypothetical protein